MFFHVIYFKQMKKIALSKHKITGKRYHVIPIPKNKLRIVDNDYINTYNRLMRHKKNFKKMTIETLLQIAYYSTPLKD